MCGTYIRFWKYDSELKVKVKNVFISAGYSHDKLSKNVLEHNTGVIIDYLMHLPGYFFQGIGIW